MAAQVLSGSGNVSYTNSTGQNVRVVINYLEPGEGGATLSFQGVTVTTAADRDLKFGKSLGYINTFGNQSGKGSSNMASGGNIDTGIPLEIALANGETFSITRSSADGNITGYNIIIIPEAG